MPLDLSTCTKSCFDCIKEYKKKHDLKKGQEFEIKCEGIPDLDNNPYLFQGLKDEEIETARVVLSPVEWAAKTLDWHCLDPDGSIWKRKNPKEYYDWIEVNPDKDIFGHSRYHRPYQAVMLDCASKRKIFRCVDGETLITMSDGSVKPIKDIRVGNSIVSVDDKNFTCHKTEVVDIFATEKQDVFEIMTKQGHGVIVSDDHPFLVKRGLVDAKNKYSIEDIETQWLSLKTGLKRGDRIAISRGCLGGEKDYPVAWDYIKSIRRVEKRVLYDISLDSIHTFIANSSIILHNCGRQIGKSEAIVVSMLFHLFVKPGVPEDEGFDIILLTPYQAQIDLLFRRLLQLIRGSPGLSNSIRRNVKAPIYTLELHNNSKVLGFTAGTKSGGNAEAVRGQHGNMLLFDEADYLSSADMDAAFSVITNYPNASVWMSSTPSGKREKFYDTSKSKLWKEFFFPSTVNPMWSSDMELTFREQLTEIAYKHEIQAEFAEQEEGVFQNVYVEAARAPYAYGDLARDPEWVYTIGVDWNDVKNGTTIAVLGYNPFQGIFTLVDKAIVSRERWNQLAACQKVADLNRAWRPVAIYIDAGHGGTQDEILRKFGWDAVRDKTRGVNHPDAKLRNILKKYDFGSKVEVRDLFTGQKTNKPAKPFLVENLVRRFESTTIRIPDSDESFIKQLLGYIIDRVTPTGTPVYKALDESTGDHFLDAVMLSAVAFTLEQTPFGKHSYSSSICFSGRMGEKSDALISPGETIIKPDPIKKIEQKNKSRPSMDRTEFVQDNSLLGLNKQLPANNTTTKTGIGLWNWPGFGSDAPRPRSKSLRKGIRARPNRPKRKNI